MYHSITFGEKNTWDDWHIVPSSRPVFNPPSQKNKILEMPGANGSLDISESLTGYPVFENREGSIEFIVMNGYKPWVELYSEIMAYLHGQRMNAVLEDDPKYYYYGRFTVNQWKSSKDWSRITIDYSVMPYKKYETRSTDTDWRWDTFNFITDAIYATIFGNIPVTTTLEEHTFTSEYFGNEPICPVFTVDVEAGMNVRFVNPTLGIDLTRPLQNGENQIIDFIMYGPSVSFYFQSISGTGTVSITFRQGRL